MALRPKNKTKNKAVPRLSSLKINKNTNEILKKKTPPICQKRVYLPNIQFST